MLPLLPMPPLRFGRKFPRDFSLREFTFGMGRRKHSSTLKQPKVYFSISSEGYGHSSRAIALAKQFTETEAVIGTYGYALERVQGFNLPCVAIPQEVKFMGNDGSFDVGKTILENQTLPIFLNNLIETEMDIIRAEKVSLVVADGRMTPVLAAERMQIPCVVVTNQSAFYPFFSKDSPLVKLFGHSFDWVMKLWLSSAEEIIIPDFPPPHTICLPNLSRQDDVKKRTRFVGPLVAWKAHEIEPMTFEYGDKTHVAVSLGGHQYRRPLFDLILRVAPKFPSLHFHLLTTFEPNGGVSDNVSLHGFVQSPARFFKACQFVITQAGHSTAMELTTLGKPGVIIPDANQIEQDNNASRMALLGMAEKISPEHMNEQTLTQAILRLLEDSRYTERAQQLAAEAERIDGPATAANILRDYASRLLLY